MLEAQKNRIYERSRMRAKGATDEQIERLQSNDRFPFKPAFVNGKRRPRELTDHEVPTGQFAFRH